MLKVKYFQRKAPKTKDFNRLKGHYSSVFNLKNHSPRLIMAVSPSKRRSERWNRRKFTLINKAYELADASRQRIVEMKWQRSEAP
jgi:hypothetical protein